MQKVIILGCPGAGKSTFARKLRDTTGLPLYYLDMMYHNADKTTSSKAEFDAKLQTVLKKDSWIIDGNYQRTIETRLEACDTTFLLDYPLAVCLEGAQNRIGKKREDLPWLETEFDSEFKQWITDFPQHQLPEIYESLAKYHGRRKIIVFKSRAEANNYLNMLTN